MWPFYDFHYDFRSSRSTADSLTVVSDNQIRPTYPNHAYGDKGSHPKSATGRFTSNEALFKCNGHLRIEFNLF